ncbi:unnamed protein product [Onchocerca ochengi]|uniref:Armadillo repeat-containing protein 5 n=1 Tax=Onchocerca ochengi TaxID=42157 RepID=A0A182EI70_ONCOC|nr:unnamed protein product [Onchocerca ochengi]
MGRKKEKSKNKKNDSKQVHSTGAETETEFDGNSDHVDNESYQEISSTSSSLYSAKAVNCQACLKSKSKPHDSYKPSVKEIVNVFCSKPTVELTRRAFQLLNELVDNYKPPIDEICRQGLDAFVIQGIQSENSFIQYYAVHAVSVIIAHMNEKQIRNLISRGLLTNLLSALQCDTLFIVQEGIETCSKIATKSAALRDLVASYGSLHVSELLSKYYQTISTEFARAVAFFLRDLCCPKPVPEVILKRAMNCARYFLRHQDKEVRLSALTAIFEVARDNDVIIAFDDTYVELILVFLDSPYRDEVKVAFDITSQFAGQLSCNTDAIVKAGFIKKILPVLAQYSTPHFGFQTCLFLTALLSRKKYVEVVLESGLGTGTYKKEACMALKFMLYHLNRSDFIKLSDRIYLEKICNILISENDDYILCALTFMSYILKACSIREEQAERRLKLATKYIRESKAYEFIAKYMNSERYDIRKLAEGIYNMYLNIQSSDNNKNEANKQRSQTSKEAEKTMKSRKEINYVHKYIRTMV